MQHGQKTMALPKGELGQILLSKTFPSFPGMAFKLMMLTDASPKPCPKQLTPLSPGEFVLCIYPVWMRKPSCYWTSTKNQEIQILLTTLSSLWTLWDVLDYYYYFIHAAVAVDSSYMTASSSASWSRFSPHSNFVNGHVSTIWFMVCRWLQSQEGDWARPHLC